MLTGVVFCFLTAFAQSCSYLLSRSYLTRHAGPYAMTIYSQLFLAILAVATLFALNGQYAFPLTAENLASLTAATMLIYSSQLLYFLCATEIEASRLSALTGLKLIVLAFLCHWILCDDISAMRWIAVVLCTLSAVGMNFAGCRISIRGTILLILLMFVNATADIVISHLIQSVEGGNIAVRAMAAAGMAYLLLGIVSLPSLLFIPRSFVRFRDSIPYSLVWFGATISLYLCFGMVHVLFVNIIVSSRGIISVLLGALISCWGYKELEPTVSRRAWLRRLIMAGLMVLAMTLYSIN